MKPVLLNPVFIFGLVVRIVLIFLMDPAPPSEWFVPFLQFSSSLATIDPWSMWIDLGGDPIAFPYGHAMWMVFLPFSLIFSLLGLQIALAYDFTLLIADFLILIVLQKFAPHRQNFLLLTYWLSPVVIIASYVLGLNDVIPALFLIYSLFLVQRVKLQAAGLVLALAISAKFSMVMAAPFYIVYILRNPAIRQYARDFGYSFIAFTIVLTTLFLLSDGGIKMLAQNPETVSIYQLVIQVGDVKSIYVTPLVYLITLYLVWRVGRLNFDLFQASIGVAFLIVVLITPSSIGWFVWCAPFLVLYQLKSDKIGFVLVNVFTIIFVFYSIPSQLQWLNSSGAQTSELISLIFALFSQTDALLDTFMLATGSVLIMQILRQSFFRSDFFRMSRKPLVIGVAGNSGSGKDTFVDAITGLFGKHSVSTVSGDDYHLWERQEPIWQVITHLNPAANDLERFRKNVAALADGKAIKQRRYDHKTGKMSKLVTTRVKNIVVASGLHALYLPSLRECYDLKIFLQMDENLRKRLKTYRDVNHRGHSLEQALKFIKDREPDSENFIRPQHRHADIIFAIQPVNPSQFFERSGEAISSCLTDFDAKRLKLVFKSKIGLDDMSLHRLLVGICGCQVDTSINDKDQQLEMTVQGDVAAEDVALASEILSRSLADFIDVKPIWQGGITGLIQLITLAHIQKVYLKRLS